MSGSTRSLSDPRAVSRRAGRHADRVLRGAVLGSAVRGRHPGGAGAVQVRPHLEDVREGQEGQPEEGQGGGESGGRICAILYLKDNKIYMMRQLYYSVTHQVVL